MKPIHSFALAALSIAVLSGCNKAPEQSSQSTSMTATSVATQAAVKAPVAKKVPHEMTIHGDTRIDNYYWMRDDKRKDPAVIAHLNAENAYTEQSLPIRRNFKQPYSMS